MRCRLGFHAWRVTGGVKPIEIGDTKDVVVVLHLNREGAEWLAAAVGSDGQADEIRDALREFDEQCEPVEAGDD